MEEKVKAVKEFPQPTSSSEIKSFIGLAGYYRKFVLNFSKIALPLTKLTARDVKFVWSEEEEKAFKELKHRLCTAPVLRQPNIEKARDGSAPFVLFTDACAKGIGAVLTQQGDDGYFHPVFFLSKGLSPAERNYAITDLEALAVVHALKRLHHLVYGVELVVKTDHQALVSLFNRTGISGRILRWAIEIQLYKVRIEYVKGQTNVVADCLSRNIPVRADEWPATEEEDIKVVAVVDTDGGESGNEEKVAETDVRDVVGREKVIGAKGVTVFEVPEESRRKVFEEYHSGLVGGHFGYRKLLRQLRRVVHWPDMAKDIERWCSECRVCYICNAKPKSVPPLKPFPVVRPFDFVGVDVLEVGLAASGNRYILTIVDRYTRFLAAYAIPNKSADCVARALFDRFVCEQGHLPRVLFSDQGTEFENQVMDAICEIVGVQQLFTKGYIPRENGLTERANGTILSMLRKKTEVHCEWDTVLPHAVFAYNISPHEATGESPFFLLHGYDAIFPSNEIPRRLLSPAHFVLEGYKYEKLAAVKLARECVNERVERYNEKMKKYYDRKKKVEKCVKATVGDRVFVRLPREKASAAFPKLTIDLSGPFRVLEASENSVLVHEIGTKKEPLRIPLDEIVRVPDSFDDTPIKVVTSRGRRGRRGGGAVAKTAMVTDVVFSVETSFTTGGFEDTACSFGQFPGFEELDEPTRQHLKTYAESRAPPATRIPKKIRKDEESKPKAGTVAEFGADPSSFGRGFGSFPTKPRAPIRGPKCYRCGEEGHLARDCRLNDFSTKCFVCHKPGHLARHCKEDGSVLKREKTPPRAGRGDFSLEGLLGRISRSVEDAVTSKLTETLLDRLVGHEQQPRRRRRSSSRDRRDDSPMSDEDRKKKKARR
jgi:transposase InsO family protein